MTPWLGDDPLCETRRRLRWTIAMDVACGDLASAVLHAGDLVAFHAELPDYLPDDLAHTSAPDNMTTDELEERRGGA